MMRLREEGQLWADQLCRRASGPSVHQRKFQRNLWIHRFRHTIMKVKDATKDSAIPVFWSLSNPQISYQNKLPTDIHKYEWFYWRLRVHLGTADWLFITLSCKSLIIWALLKTKKFDSKDKKRKCSNVCVQRLRYHWGN